MEAVHLSVMSSQHPQNKSGSSFTGRNVPSINTLILNIANFKIIVIDKFALRKAKRNVSKHLKYISKYLPNFVQDWNLELRMTANLTSQYQRNVWQRRQKWRIGLRRITCLCLSFVSISLPFVSIFFLLFRSSPLVSFPFISLSFVSNFPFRFVSISLSL